MKTRAHISEDGRYRFSLERTWDEEGMTVLFIMLNPSTADAEQDDPTITRCIRRAKEWGYGKLVVVNLFALRATDPDDLKHSTDPVGPLNDDYIIIEARNADLIMAGWGISGDLHGRDKKVEAILKENRVLLHCLGTTKKGHPRHPLYVPYKQKPEVLGL